MQRSGAQILDVREGIDFEGGHLKGALSIALNGKYATWAGSMLATDRPIVVHCEGGYRSAIAASLLQKLGRPDVHDLVGGFKAWSAAKLPTAAAPTSPRA
jgi:hydroxyacylglutathione hydrolase